MATRRTTDQVDVGTRMIEVALDLLASEGPEALTTRRIATEAGTTTMTLYSRFGDKRGIESAVCIAGFTRLGEAMVVAARGRRRPLESIVKVARAYRRFAMQNPALYGLMFRASSDGTVADDRTHAAAMQAFTTVSERVEAYAATRPLSADSSTVAVRVWAVCHGSCALELDRIGVFATATDAFFADSIRAIVRGHHRAPSDGATGARR